MWSLQGKPTFDLPIYRFLLIVITLIGSWVPTDLGNYGAKSFGIEEAPDSVEESVDGMIKLFDVATKGTHGGKFWNYHGEQEAW